MGALLCAALALGYSLLIPRLILSAPGTRHTPRATLLLWQSLALGGVLAALTGAAIVITTANWPPRAPIWWAAALLAGGLAATVVARLGFSGHVIGTRLRRLRRRHRELVDALAQPDDGVHLIDGLPPVAYCVPALGRSRLVMSQAARERLAADEIAAVLAHERAHLAARHDLLIEAFMVLRRAFPWHPSSDPSLTEVRFLVEAAADRHAARQVGPLPVARSLVALGGATAPDGSVGIADTSPAARVALLKHMRPRRLQAALLSAAALTTLGLPPALLLGAL